MISLATKENPIIAGYCQASYYVCPEISIEKTNKESMENKFLQLLNPEEIVATSGGQNLKLITEDSLLGDISSILEPVIESWLEESMCPCPCYPNDMGFMDKFFPHNKSKEEEKKDELLKKECCCHPLFI